MLNDNSLANSVNSELKKENIKLAAILILLMSAMFIFITCFSFFNGTYSLSPKGWLSLFNDIGALWYIGFILFLGLMPVSLIIRNRKLASIWASSTLLLAGCCFFGTIN